MSDSSPLFSPVEDLLRSLGTARRGLTSQEATRRASVSAGGENTQSRTWQLLLRQFTSPIMIVLIVATFISVFVGDVIDGVIIVIIILASGLLGFIQEWRAHVAMTELIGRTIVHADVLRDGHEVEVEFDDVVVGDVVVLRAGDLVPADLRILESDRLLVDESTITGESIAQEKSSKPVADPISAEERIRAVLPSNALFFGSHVVSGTATGVALSVADDTRFGAVIRQLQSRGVRTRFEREMSAFGGMLARVIIVLVAVVAVVNFWLGRPWIEALMFALAVAVGITPQLLPAITTVSLSLGARRLARQQVLVKRLDAIEDVGGMSILCCDKTGTLTAGVVTLDAALDVAGEISEQVRELAALNAGLQVGFPNALDAAILDGLRPSSASLLDELPYDFERRRLSVLIEQGGQRVLITKGAVASVIPICATARKDGREAPLDVGLQQSIIDRVRDLSAAGFRVLAVATRPHDGASPLTIADEADLCFEGFLTFSDPPTTQARDAISALRELGVRPVLITGDNAYIAAHVAQAVGLETATLVRGSDIAQMTDDQLRAVVRGTSAYAEVDPEQKERIVKALQADASTVGFLGDGINDAAALRAADVGISVDGAADAAKHAAALVIMTKDLSVIANGICLGRATFSNTLKYIRVTISANFGNMVSLVVASAFLPFLPLLPVQILLLNLLSDVPALTVASDRVDHDEVTRPRSWDLAALRKFMIIFGLASSAVDFTAFLVLSILWRSSAEYFHSTWFVLSVITECLALLVLRSARPMWRSRPGWLLAVSSACVALVGVVLPFTMLGSAIGFVAIGIKGIILVALLGLAYVAVNEALKLLWSRTRDAWVV